MSDPAFAAAKRASTLQLLFKAARLLNDEAVARLNAGGVELRAAHTTLFPHLDRAGVRQTALAARVGISKQAVGQLVDDLERHGVVERIRDPDDGRARLVRLTDEGVAAMMHGLGVLGEVAEGYGEALGPGGLASLHDLLTRLVDAAEAQGTPPDERSHPGRSSEVS